MPGRPAACACDRRVAAVGVLSLRSWKSVEPFTSVRAREFRVDCPLLLGPSESSSSSSPEPSSPRLEVSD